MNRYYGKIGYAVSEETAPGVWKDKITERYYFGDVLKDSRRWESGIGINDDLNINNRLSIIADEFANGNFHNIKYAEYMGALWKVTNVEVQSPRLILTIGGEYNGPQTATA